MLAGINRLERSRDFLTGQNEKTAEAVLWASEAAKGSDRFDELKEYFYDKPDECPADLNWVKRTSYLYFGQYSCEGDHIEVRKATVRSV